MIRNSKQHTTNGLRQKKLILFIKKNYLLVIFVGCILFVGLIAFYKLFIAKPTYIYAKVKVGQGLWWANTQRPSLWFVNAISQAIEQKDLIGKPLVKMIDVSYYPYYGTSQYDVYITIKLKVSSVGSKGTYTFNREAIGVSSPIDLEFPNVQFSGTIIALSERPFAETYVKKIIYLTKRIPYPWEYDQIEVGDSQTNGRRTVFTILDKSYGDISDTTLLQQGTLINTLMNIYTVKAEIWVKKVDDKYIFGEDTIIAPGKLLLGVSTNKFTFSDYYITKVE